MRICLVSEQYPPDTAAGGIGTETLTKAEMLTSLGHTVHVLSAAGHGTPGAGLQTTEVNGVVVHRLQPPGAMVHTNEAVTYWLGYAWLVLVHLRALQRELDFDLIHFPEFGGEGYLYLLDRDQWDWTPVAVQLHAPLMLLAEHIGWPEQGSDLHEIGGRMEEVTIRRADGLLSSSATTADFVAREYGIDRDRIDVVHCGIDMELFRPDPEAQAAGGPIVLFVGNVIAQKGVDVALDAVLRLRQKYPDLVLRIVGRDLVGLGDRLLDRARKACAGNAVELVGPLEERVSLARQYREATVVCTPSSFEGGPVLVNVEAMACGCPVVTGDNPGAAEAVVDAETGYLVPAGDVEATAAALDRILGDPERRARLSRRARSHVEDYFGAQAYAARVFRAYERTLDHARANLARLERQEARS